MILVSSTSCGSADTIEVAINPGEIVLTVTPFFATSHFFQKLKRFILGGFHTHASSCNSTLR